MQKSTGSAHRKGLARLVEAVSGNRSSDTLARFMPPGAWNVLASYLEQRKVEQGHVLIGQGTLDRTLYVVETGMLRVQYLRPDAELEIAQLGPGSVVGEGAFFCDIPRNATVQVTEPGAVWALTTDSFGKLSKDEPSTALAVAMAFGAVLATRMLDISKKVAVT